MQTKITLLAALSAVALSVTGCHDSALDKAPGTYEKTTSSTDARGTEYKKTTTTDVSVDSEGKKKAVVKSKSTTDPEGLLNKKTTSKVEAVEEER